MRKGYGLGENKAGLCYDTGISRQRRCRMDGWIDEQMQRAQPISYCVSGLGYGSGWGSAKGWRGGVPGARVCGGAPCEQGHGRMEVQLRGVREDRRLGQEAGGQEGGGVGVAVGLERREVRGAQGCSSRTLQVLAGVTRLGAIVVVNSSGVVITCGPSTSLVVGTRSWKFTTIWRLAGPLSKVREWPASARLVAGLRPAQIGVAVKGGVDLGSTQCRQPLTGTRSGFVKSWEGAQQRDSWGPLYLAAPLQTALERVQEGQPEVIVLAYLDDALLVGPPDWPSHSACKVGDLLDEADTGFLAEEMPGARGELDFINILGEPVGKPEVVTAEMLRKVEEMHGILPALNETNARGAPGLAAGGWPSLVLLRTSLGRHAAASSDGYREDLGVGNRLPHIWSLQTAMQKLSEAVEEIEEARGVTVSDAKRSGQHVVFDVATVRPMVEAPWGSHDGSGSGSKEAAMRFLKKIQQRRFTRRRCMEVDVAEEEEVNEEGTTKRGGSWQFCGVEEELALMDRAWEDAFEEANYATQAGRDGQEGEMQGSGGAQHGPTRHLPVGQARQ
ncbi:hypothetical protein CYMTET_34343 [Cymbomonas tetramitiformis]|uniref:Uncharacterized protein n=1 Tax=Cymbomonas tetramitiformis TaxID=36881 RepID=A0AAE0FB54_9CHLO|nr:hypothetical protein CYMTET_34343 [Cymbomonas tetramitiformis]